MPDEELLATSSARAAAERERVAARKRRRPEELQVPEDPLLEVHVEELLVRVVVENEHVVARRCRRSARAC